MIRSIITPAFVKTKTEENIAKSVNEYKLFMAKNEMESCIISVRSDEMLNGVSVVLLESSQTNISAEVLYVHTLMINGEGWPDPLSPVGGSDVKENVTTSFLLRFSSDKDEKSGDHVFTFGLKDSTGEILAKYYITVHVWDFAYPETPSMATALGFYDRCYALYKGWIKLPFDPIPEENKKELEEARVAYYDYMLKNKISAYELPYDILDPRADAYMSDPRVTAFVVPNRVSDEKLVQYYNKLKSNPEWLKKAHIYAVDEPTSNAMLDEIAGHNERFKRLCPEVKHMSAFFCNTRYDEEQDQIDVMAKSLDAICFKVCCFSDKWSYGLPMAGKHSSVLDRVKAISEKGKKIWSYVCWEPERPYANLLVNEDGINHRILFWQQYLCGSKGFLYWCVNHWDCAGGDPWHDMATVKWLKPDCYGDGSLFYPGDAVGFDGPCASLRLEAIRDGIEDYELLKFASELFGEEWVKNKAQSVTQSITEYTSDNELFSKIRTEIGNAIEQALNN